jgi:flagellum-specific ATP synthase
MGGYVQGQDTDLDVAMQLWPSIVNFLKQNDGELASFSDSAEALKNLIGMNK